LRYFFVCMITLTETAYLVMLAHCQAQYPLEACGFLGGRDGVSDVVTAVENILRSPVAYEMAPKQQLEAMLYMEDQGLELTAAFHSHPHGPSRPSATDVAQAYYPDMAQFIISLQSRSSPSVRVFLLGPEEIQELDWRIV
jgi:[CysO sulfur-carrier protein]-S-L-cysteine hydrolase